MFKNHRTRDIDTGECLYYSSKGFAIRDAVCEIEKGKRITVEDLTSTGEWISDLNECFILERIILSSQQEKSHTIEKEKRIESEIAHFRQTQELLDQSARIGLYGFQMVARHDFIEARIEQGADRIVRLMQAGKIEQAVALMNAPMWEELTVSQDMQGMRIE